MVGNERPSPPTLENLSRECTCADDSLAETLRALYSNPPSSQSFTYEPRFSLPLYKALSVESAPRCPMDPPPLQTLRKPIYVTPRNIPNCKSSHFHAALSSPRNLSNFHVLRQSQDSISALVNVLHRLHISPTSRLLLALPGLRV